MDLVQPYTKPPRPPTNVDGFCWLNQLCHISWKEGMVDLASLKKTHLTSAETPPPLMDLIHQNMCYFLSKFAHNALEEFLPQGFNLWGGPFPRGVYY